MRRLMPLLAICCLAAAQIAAAACPMDSGRFESPAPAMMEHAGGHDGEMPTQHHGSDEEHGDADCRLFMACGAMAPGPLAPAVAHSLPAVVPEGPLPADALPLNTPDLELPPPRRI